METPSQKNSKTRLIHGDVHQRICQLATQSRGNIISFLPAKKLRANQGHGNAKTEKVWKGEISCILPYLTISYHILPYLTTLFALLVGFEFFYWGLLYLETKSNQIKSNQCHESCQLIWWFWEHRIHRIHVFDDSGGFQVGNFFLPTGIQVLLGLELFVFVTVPWVRNLRAVSRMAPGQVDIFEDKTAWINVVTKTLLY